MPEPDTDRVKAAAETSSSGPGSASHMLRECLDERFARGSERRRVGLHQHARTRGDGAFDIFARQRPGIGLAEEKIGPDATEQCRHGARRHRRPEQPAACANAFGNSVQRPCGKHRDERQHRIQVAARRNRVADECEKRRGEGEQQHRACRRRDRIQTAPAAPSTTTGIPMVSRQSMSR